MKLIDLLIKNIEKTGIKKGNEKIPFFSIMDTRNKDSNGPEFRVTVVTPKIQDLDRVLAAVNINEEVDDYHYYLHRVKHELWR